LIKILIHTPVHSQILEGKKLLKDLLSFKTEFYQQLGYKRKRMEGRKLLYSRSGVFYTGLVGMIEEFAKKHDIPLVIEKSPEFRELNALVKPSADHSLLNFTLRYDQERLVKNAIEVRRGVIVAPTGSGKTCIASAIIKAFDGYNILFLCHSLGLVNQTISEFKKFGFKSVCRVSGSEKEILGRIVVSNMQAFVRMNLEELSDHFHVVILDECHVAQKSGSTYEKILSQLLAPIRLGFTATIPENEEKKLMLTGLVGPLIDEISIEEGKELKLLAETKLKLIPIPPCSAIRDLKTYADIYQKGVVEYALRNRIIIREAVNLIDDGNTVLVFVTKIEHGLTLHKMAKDVGVRVKFVRGETSGEERESIRHQLNQKKIEMVIATSVWRECINVPTLNAGIIAAGMKSKIAKLQSIGRILRKSSGKDYAIIIDFIDVAKYLSEHFCERLHIYEKLGWL